MFIDELTLFLRAGRGGDGVVRWRHEKGKEYSGPSGGNGGKGGDIYVVAVRDIGILSAYRNIKVIEARPGDDGAKDSKQGKSGQDVEIKLPIGSRLKNLYTGYLIELLKEGERVLILEGGKGGLGNEHFKSSININPKESTQGLSAEEAEFKIELLLVVDVGIIGLPNAGKSSLLNSLTKSRSKVGDFPFTTLEPALGSFYGYIFADIPGLIEGASKGKGLGHKFLRHIERTKTLLHCISAELDDPLKAYEVVRKELGLYNKEMLEKPEIIALTKTDTASPEEIESKLDLLRNTGREVFPISIIDDKLLKRFSDSLTQSLEKISHG